MKLLLESLISKLWFMFGTMKITLEEDGLEDDYFSDLVGEETVEPYMITGRKKRRRRRR
jgi:hypothetical protein